MIQRGAIAGRRSCGVLLEQRRGARGMAAGEGLDDHQGRTAAGARAEVGGGEDLLGGMLVAALGGGNERGERRGEQLPSACQVLDPCGIGQEAVMADAVKSGIM